MSEKNSENEVVIEVNPGKEYRFRRVGDYVYLQWGTADAMPVKYVGWPPTVESIKKWWHGFIY